MNPVESAMLARRWDVVIVFAIRLEGEGFDNADLSLPWGQDAVIEAVAAANPHTVVVLETGNPVAMPWLDGVSGVVEAWYPGQAGGQAVRGRSSRVVSTRQGASRSRSLPTWLRPPPRTPRYKPALGHAYDHPLRRGRRGRLPLVRPDRRQAAVRVWARSQLRQLRL